MGRRWRASGVYCLQVREDPSALGCCPLQCNIDGLQCARSSHSLQRGIRLYRHSTPAGVNFDYVPKPDVRC